MPRLEDHHDRQPELNQPGGSLLRVTVGYGSFIGSLRPSKDTYKLPRTGLAR